MRNGCLAALSVSALVVLGASPASAESPLADLFSSAVGAGGCNAVDAEGANRDFKIFCVVAVVLASVLASVVWWLLERRAVSTAAVRLAIATQLAGATAFAVIALRPPLGTFTAMLGDPLCAAYFLLGSLGALPQGLVLGLAPAEVLTFVLVVLLNKLAR